MVREPSFPGAGTVAVHPKTSDQSPGARSSGGSPAKQVNGSRKNVNGWHASSHSSSPKVPACGPGPTGGNRLLEDPGVRRGFFSWCDFLQSVADPTVIGLNAVFQLDRRPWETRGIRQSRAPNSGGASRGTGLVFRLTGRWCSDAPRPGQEVAPSFLSAFFRLLRGSTPPSSAGSTPNWRAPACPTPEFRHSWKKMDSCCVPSRDNESETGDLRTWICVTEPISDAGLLDALASHRDEAAFGELVKRHGPQVLKVVAGVCRASTTSRTFSRRTFAPAKAAAVSWKELVESWLWPWPAGWSCMRGQCMATAKPGTTYQHCPGGARAEGILGSSDSERSPLRSPRGSGVQ